MPTTIRVRFPAGRYHATPWDRQVNEGIPEWPPSPWRLLRALVSVWKVRDPGMEEQRVREALLPLAGPPVFALPPAVLSHTRHWMPWFSEIPKRFPSTDRTLVFDTFLRLGEGSSVGISWPVELEEGPREDLRELLALLPYLGRAESWCEALLTEEVLGANCFPLGANAPQTGEMEVIRVLVPQSPLRLEELMIGVGELRRRHLDPVSPPGSRWVRYLRPSAAFLPPRALAPALRPGPPVEVMRFALDARPLPRLTEAVKVGDLARRAAMAWYGRLNEGGASPVLAGKDAGGAPLKGHQHAHYLPSDEDGDGWIDHLTIWAPLGLHEREQQALARMSEEGLVRPKGDRWGMLLVGRSSRSNGNGPLFSRSARWRSLTPFVLTRHVKWRGGGPGNSRSLVDGPEEQIRSELRYRGFPEAKLVDWCPRYEARGTTLPWAAFDRWRGRGSRAEGATGFCVSFEKPIQGPLALGYGSHFGLGLFIPDEEESAGQWGF